MAQPTITMTQKELSRYEAIKKLIDGHINGSQAAKQLNLSVRQIKRIKTKVIKRGPKGIIHGSRGRQSNRKTKVEIIEKVRVLIKKHYRDFGPTLAKEKLEERHGLKLGKETTRQIMIQAGLWKVGPRRSNKEYRSWRPRKQYFGEMQQFDGSYHLWFENRGEKCCLLASIDDATGSITKAEFTSDEGVVPVFTFWRAYVLKHGKPAHIYLDRHSTYHQNQKTVLSDPEHLTQFQRAMQDLDINVINARSPQAKGRVERLFGTLQDRLVKELRLQNIKSLAEANQFLQKTFIAKFNSKFAVRPEKNGDLHQEVGRTDKENLDRIFSIQKTRIVNNDFTIQYENSWYQLDKTQPTLVCRKEAVLIERRINGEIKISRRGKYLNFQVLPKRPEKVATIKIAALTRTEPIWKPPADHPWRQQIIIAQKQKIAKTAIINQHQV